MMDIWTWLAFLALTMAYAHEMMWRWGHTLDYVDDIA